MRAGREAERGFTLVEVIVAIAVAGIVVALLYGAFGSLYETWTGEGLKSDMRQNARVALDTVTRDLEMAGYHTTNYGDPNKGNLPVTRAEANKIEIDQHLVDLDTGTYEPKMIYYHLGTDVSTGRQNLYRQVRLRPGLPTGDDIVAENIESFELTYFDSDGMAITALPAFYTFGDAPPQALKDIRRICVSIGAGTSRRLPKFLRKVVSPQTEQRESSIALSACVTPRNLSNEEIIADIIPPCTPANLNVSDTRDCNGKLCLRWDRCTDPDLDGYIVSYGSGKSLRIPLHAIADKVNPGIRLGGDNVLITRYADRITSPNTYSITVAAYDSSGNRGNPSTPVSGNPDPDMSSCAGAGSDTTVNPAKPGAPQTLTAATGDENTLLLSWAQPADNGGTPWDESLIVGYRLYRSQTPFTTGAPVPESYRIANETALPSGVASYLDSGLEGCATYYYALAAVNCDETLLSTYTYSPSGTGDYASVSGAPVDLTPPPPASLAGTSAGWQRIFIGLDIPTAAESDDFDRTEIYFNEGSVCPTLTSGTVSDGTLIPDSDGASPGTFTGRGSQVVVFDSTTEASPSAPTLTNQGQYCLLAVSYDRCGNSATDSTSLALIDLCGDDPPGPPPEWPVNPTLTSCDPSSLKLTWEYPPKYYTGPSTLYDFAGYRLWRTGPTPIIDIELTSGPNWSEDWTDTANLREGGSYRYSVVATDCVYENRYSEYPANYSLALLIPSDADWYYPGRIETFEGYSAPPPDPANFHPANFVTSFSDPLHPYTYHNNVKFHLQNTSAGSMTIEKITVDWSNANVVLQAVAIGGAPSSTPVTVSLAGGVPSGSTVTLGTTIEDRALGMDLPSDPVPMAFRFTNLDGSVNRFTDLRGEILHLSLHVQNDSLQPSDCRPEEFLVAVPEGPRIGEFFQDPSCVFPTPSRAVPGPTGVARDDDLVVPAKTAINVFGEVEDRSGVLFPILGGAAQGFDTLSLFHADNSLAPSGDLPVMPDTSTQAELPLLDVGGGSYAVYDEENLSGSLITAEVNRAVWYYVLAVDRTGNFDRLPNPDYGNYAYYQGVFDPCYSSPLAPVIYGTTSHSGTTLEWESPTRYGDCGDIQPSDTLTYDVSVWEIPGGAPSLICADTTALTCYHSADLTAASFAYAVKTKNTCTNPGPRESLSSNIFYECEGDQDFCPLFTALPPRALLGEPLTLTAAGVCLFAGNGRSDTATFSISSGIGTETFTVTETGDGGTFSMRIATSTTSSPPPLTALSADTSAAEAVIPVLSTTGYPPRGVIAVGGEIVRYDSITGTSFNGASRGAMGTSAADHATGAIVTFPLDGLAAANSDDSLEISFITGSTVRAVKYVSLGSAGCSDTPDPPGSFDVIRDGADPTRALLTWSKPAFNTDGSALTDFAGYLLDHRRCTDQSSPCSSWQLWTQVEVGDSCTTSHEMTVQENYLYEFRMLTKDSCTPTANVSTATPVVTIN